MNDKEKIGLMNAVKHDVLFHVQGRIEHCQLQHDDESFFDYELLKAALQRKHQTIVNYLLRKGCRVVNPNETSFETPLRLAMKLGNSTIIKKILNSGASIYDKDDNGDTVLHAAFKEKHYGAVDAVLNYCSTKNAKQLNSSLRKLDKNNEDDMVHFHIACARSNLKVLKKYLSCGFDVNKQFTLNSEDLNGLNPVHYVIMKNETDMLNIFLQHNADLSIKNNAGYTPLQMIYYSGLSGFGEYRISQIFKIGNKTKFINATDNNGVSHFHLCCATNSSDCVQVFIDEGVNVNSFISSRSPLFPGFTPLHFAVMQGHEEIVKLLLENGADINKADVKGVTPLHLSCELSEEVACPIIKILLDYKASTTATDEKGQTFLHTAFKHVNCEETKMFDMLLSTIPKSNFTDHQGLSHFHIVCARNDVNRVNDFLKSGVAIDSFVESGEYKGYTGLHFAVLYNQKDVVEVLLNWKAQINTKTSLFKVTPLHLACNYNYNGIYYKNANDDKINNLDGLSKLEKQIEIIKLLLAHGADVNAQDFSGKTPLFYICPLGRSVLQLSKEFIIKLTDIINILLHHKANINVQLDNQESILHFIIKNSFLKNPEELVDIVINKGADIQAFDRDGLTPLHVAVKLKNKEIVKIFLKHKANINATSKNCMTPLQVLLKDFSDLSTEEKDTHTDLLLLLLENGSDINVRYKLDRTIRPPWYDVIRDGNIVLSKILLKYGIDINMEDESGRSLLISALKKNRKFEHDLFFSSAIIFYILRIHILKLQYAGMYISEKVRTGMTEMSAHYRHIHLTGSVSDNVLQSDCTEELDKMKIAQIDNYSSMYNILLKNAHDLGKFVKNSSFANKILEDEKLSENFPLYCDLLKSQIRKGLMRNNVLESANASMSSLIGLNFPDLCSSLVMKYLTNEDIVNLKFAALMRGFKRGRDDCSSTEEPLVKMQKKE